MGFFGRSNNKGKAQVVSRPPVASSQPYFDSNLPAQTKYVAPSPTHSVAKSSAVASQRPANNTDNDMVIVRHTDEEDTYGDVENATSSFTRQTDGESVPRTYASMKPSHLNSLFNGHLMKWKFDAEEGSCFVRVPACKFVVRSMLNVPHSQLDWFVFLFSSLGSVGSLGHLYNGRRPLSRCLGTSFYCHDGCRRHYECLHSIARRPILEQKPLVGPSAPSQYHDA